MVDATTVPKCVRACSLDAPCQIALYGAKCCTLFPFDAKFACCEATSPVPPSSMPDQVLVEEASMGKEFLICAFGCGMCTMYIPETRTDAFGIEDKSLCCCCAADQKFCMLPQDAGGYEIVLCRAGQVTTNANARQAALPTLASRAHAQRQRRSSHCTGLRQTAPDCPKYPRIAPNCPESPRIAPYCTILPRSAPSAEAALSSRPPARPAAVCREQVKCVDPPILRGGPLCKGVQRCFFTITKFAFPCDAEVPFALACFGIKCAEKVPSGGIEWFKSEPVDPATGMRPMFPALSRRVDGAAAPMYVADSSSTPMGMPVSDKIERT